MNTRAEPEVTSEPTYQGPGAALTENPSEDGTRDRDNTENRHEMMPAATCFGAEVLGWFEAERKLLEAMTGELAAEGK